MKEGRERNSRDRDLQPNITNRERAAEHKETMKEVGERKPRDLQPNISNRDRVE